MTQMHEKMEKSLNKSGFTLVEILVVIAIFAFLGILITRAVILTVGGSKKSESIVKVRENLDYSISIIERQIRNANSISECPNSSNDRIDYIDKEGHASYFQCSNNNGIGYIASGSAQLNHPDIDIKTCSLNCIKDVTTSPEVVTIYLEASDITSGAQAAPITVSTIISLRNY